jgi:hypothetical protein
MSGDIEVLHAGEQGILSKLLIFYGVPDGI